MTATEEIWRMWWGRKEGGDFRVQKQAFRLQSIFPMKLARNGHFAELKINIWKNRITSEFYSPLITKC